jgi:hypothetical protein
MKSVDALRWSSARATLSPMWRKAWASLVLAALMAAFVPGGLAPAGGTGTGSCCGERCPMPSSMAEHCQGGSMGHSHHATCTCAVSRGRGSAISPTAFHFSFNLAAVLPWLLPAAEFANPIDASPVPLNGYVYPVDQPPRA